MSSGPFLGFNVCFLFVQYLENRIGPVWHTESFGFFGDINEHIFQLDMAPEGETQPLLPAG